MMQLNTAGLVLLAEGLRRYVEAKEAAARQAEEVRQLEQRLALVVGQPAEIKEGEA